MKRSPAFNDFVRRYFGVFIGAWFCSLVAVAWSFVLVWGTWFRAASKDEMRASLVALLVVFMLGHGAVVRGRAWGGVGRGGDVRGLPGAGDRHLRAAAAPVSVQRERGLFIRGAVVAEQPALP